MVEGHALHLRARRFGCEWGRSYNGLLSVPHFWPKFAHGGLDHNSKQSTVGNVTVNISHVRNSSGALPDPPSGRQHEITSGGYRAVITEVGAALRRLSHDDRPLVVGFSVDEVMPSYRGAQLIPWPNRIADGRYSFAGQEHQVPLTEPDRGNALHGFVVWESWRTVLHVRDRVVLSHRVQPRQGYPWRLDVTADFALGPDGLRCTVEALNTGHSAAPYGYGPHPYLLAGESPLDEWSLEVPAAEDLEDRKSTRLNSSHVATSYAVFCITKK